MEERREVGGEGGFARVDSVAKDSPAENAVSPSLSLSPRSVVWGADSLMG